MPWGAETVRDGATDGAAPGEATGVGLGVARLTELLQGRRVVVLSGAGLSTESGIPDYRGPGRREPARRPMLHQEFMADPAARARYWARSAVGWPRFHRARPNAGHRALARLEAAGVVQGVLTQNVDGLHQAAGSRKVLDLHGSLARVRCTACQATLSRWAMQDRLLALNPSLRHLQADGPAGPAPTRPDGDVHLPPEAAEGIRVPPCQGCGGILKPDVVFFGENVPRDRVAEAWRIFDGGELLLVVGSSLTVFSGRRFVLRAVRDGMPVAIVNLGPTRADDCATLKVEAATGVLLPPVARRLSAA